MAFFEGVILTDSIEFIIEQKGEFCLFIASGTYRLGWIGKTFFGKAIENSLSSVKKRRLENMGV